MPVPAAPLSHDHDPPDVQGGLPTALVMVSSCMPVLGAVLLPSVLPRMQEYFEGVAG